ncbi:hypothetical protein DHEL01_v208667 [Diaporthe helianthi]|uniref:Uncharacterized protein n=1 Tax=Diaporthe helianthi TaxID=158607 RepID=A0A2P5HRP3_DIAHE|nr:hypothetical protein DHEL01_v208667 [Diaporthe helianthi]
MNIRPSAAAPHRPGARKVFIREKLIGNLRVQGRKVFHIYLLVRLIIRAAPNELSLSSPSAGRYKYGPSRSPRCSASPPFAKRVLHENQLLSFQGNRAYICTGRGRSCSGASSGRSSLLGLELATASKIQVPFDQICIGSAQPIDFLSSMGVLSPTFTCQKLPPLQVKLDPHMLDKEAGASGKSRGRMLVHVCLGLYQELPCAGPFSQTPSLASNGALGRPPTGSGLAKECTDGMFGGSETRANNSINILWSVLRRPGVLQSLQSPELFKAFADAEAGPGATDCTKRL